MREDVRSVVIVEDEPDLVLLLSELLASVGFRTEAVSGSRAVERISSTRPDVVVLDYSLPGMTGREVVERLKQSHGLVVPPILLVTAMPNVEALGREIGADRFLRKPFDLDAFIDAVTDLAGGRAGKGGIPR